MSFLMERMRKAAGIVANPVSQPPQAGATASPAPPSPTQPTAGRPPPAPCQLTLPANSPYGPAGSPCLSPARWIDVYGNWHCCCCQPPRSMSQCRQMMMIVLTPAGESIWWPMDRDYDPASAAEEKNIEEKKSERKLSFDEIFSIQQFDRLDKECLGLSEEKKIELINSLNDFIFYVQSGSIKLSVQSQSEKPPLPPASARVWYLTESGHQVELVRGKGKKKLKSEVDSIPDDATWMTWEGAPKWYRLPPRQVAPQPAGMAGSAA